MSRIMQTIQEDIEAVVPYSMHVSSRYLELTKQKLELTRLPRENEVLSTEEQWMLGAPKSVLEPLLDHWIETYDWRAEEDGFNSTLPQFRTLISLAPGRDGVEKKPIRTHFVHKRSTHIKAVPLLFCHSWPGSFVEVQRVIDALAAPKGDGEMAFHVVCPSIPGFGFSDASEDPEFGVHGAAEVFAGLMERLGYDSWVVCGSGWGFDICRALAMRYPRRCLAVHTTNPVFATPTVRDKPLLWVKYQLAKLTKASYPALSFGYLPSEVTSSSTTQAHQGSDGRPIGPAMHQLLSQRPQTLAFSLCDSPVGLLAVILDLVYTRSSGTSSATRPTSPFLDPGELAAQDVEDEAAGHERVRSDETVQAPQNGGTGEIAVADRRPWSPTDILNWTMMMWLPGAEAGLRWLRRAHIETSMADWGRFCSVPLGISSFRTHSAPSPLMWGSASWSVAWIRRHGQAAEMPASESPRQLVNDVRECFGRLLEGRLKAKSPEVMV